jgi:hypothetical protein
VHGNGPICTEVGQADPRKGFVVGEALRAPTDASPIPIAACRPQPAISRPRLEGFDPRGRPGAASGGSPRSRRADAGAQENSWPAASGESCPAGWPPLPRSSHRPSSPRKTGRRRAAGLRGEPMETQARRRDLRVAPRSTTWSASATWRSHGMKRGAVSERARVSAWRRAERSTQASAARRNTRTRTCSLHPIVPHPATGPVRGACAAESRVRL